MSQTSGLTVRQHEREAFELTVEFVVCEAHREQVRFSPMSSAPEPHVIRGTARDISPGGMGLVCRHFVPRMCEGTVRVFNPNPVGTAADGTPIHEVVFEHRVKVRRIALNSHEPTYAMGVAFLDPEPDIDQRVAKLLALVKGRGTNAKRGGEGADA
jgi:c-di-GMP-binding flagellar brake protein YcgR